VSKIGILTPNIWAKTHFFILDFMGIPTADRQEVQELRLNITKYDSSEVYRLRHYPSCDLSCWGILLGGKLDKG
jgi:hypothetical protein